MLGLAVIASWQRFASWATKFDPGGCHALRQVVDVADRAGPFVYGYVVADDFAAVVCRAHACVV